VKVIDIITVSAKYDYNEPPGSSYIDSIAGHQAAKVVQLMGQDIIQWEARAEDWKDRSWSGDGHAWAGLILALVPRLRYLTIEFLSRQGLWSYDSRDDRRFARNPLEKLFGDISDSAPWEGTLPVELDHIAGLRNLEVLGLLARKLEINWCLLPNVQTLEVGQDCLYPNATNDCANSVFLHTCPAVSNLTIEIVSHLTVSQGCDRTRALRDSFLSSSTFPLLEKLQTQPADQAFVGYEAGDDNLLQESDISDRAARAFAGSVIRYRTTDSRNACYPEIPSILPQRNQATLPNSTRLRLARRGAR
jgi:hypothetical protein